MKPALEPADRQRMVVHTVHEASPRRILLPHDGDCLVYVRDRIIFNQGHLVDTRSSIASDCEFLLGE